VTEVARLGETQIERAANVLARALHDDPLMVYAMPDADHRASALVGHFRGLTRFGHMFGEVDVTEGDVVGAALWQVPGADITPELAEKADLGEVWRSLGEDGAVRLGEVMDHLQPINASDISSDHWYLMMVGVEPEQQSRGIGRALLEPGINRATDAGLPCYLVSFNERNLPFYERLGFRVATSEVEPKSGLRFWTFLR
jgi:GNAT superfamily N-acetyltransferase